MELRNNKPLISELEKLLKETETRIDAIDQRLVGEKLCNANFLKLYNERHALMIRRRQSIQKLQNARKGNPWGEAEMVIK